MCSKMKMKRFTAGCSKKTGRSEVKNETGKRTDHAALSPEKTAADSARSYPLEYVRDLIEQADAIVIGAGAGLSSAAGLTYSGERFERYFKDFQEKYGITDMYSGGFYPFKTLEEYWAWWSRHIFINRYEKAPGSVYDQLLSLVKDKNYFVITTNVDHQFQLAGFDPGRLYYMQGDYGLWQCSVPCHEQTYDNESVVREMIARQRDMKIPSDLVPHCPVCGRPMTMNLRIDNHFVQDEGWYAAQKRYHDFLERYADTKILFLELGVGYNTPGIIKIPFWKLVAHNPKAHLVSVNLEEELVPEDIQNQSLVLQGQISTLLDYLSPAQNKAADCSGYHHS